LAVVIAARANHVEHAISDESEIIDPAYEMREVFKRRGLRIGLVAHGVQFVGWR
jgi:hypothetical protein